MKTIKLELYSHSTQEMDDFEEDCKAIAEEYNAEIEINN